MAENDLRVLNDRYEIHRRLARGGMAQVYIARDRSLDRPVAVKELAPEFATDPSFVERFRREAQAAANLTHPNVVGVYDWGSQDGTYFIVMEYIDGPSLSKVLRTDGPLHPRRAAEIASEVAAGLGFAHSRGVVHRDVKPGNVLLTRSGESKVTDFGIARAMSSPDEDLTQAGSVMGTATYFSPEQAQGLPVDPRSDLYSLGVVLYEMVAGRAPFNGDTPLAIAYKHVQDTPEPPSRHISDLPAGLEAIIMKLLSKQPDDRYRSAEDLRADLKRFLAGEQTAAEREGYLVGAAAATTAMMSGADQATIVQPATVVGAAPIADELPVEEEPEGGGSRTALFIGLLVLLLALLGGLLWWFVQSMDEGDLVTVPPVVGLTIEEAQERLRDANLEWEVTREPSAEIEPGRVISQDPAQGEEVEEGTTVQLVVSSGQDLVVVPDVVGRPQAEAVAELEAAGLRARVETVEDPDAEEGIVLSQDPAADLEVPPDSEVTITVAVGVEEVAVPRVRGMPLAQAERTLQTAGFRTTVTEQSADDVAPGDVIGSDPGEGTMLEPGSTVTIIVSTGQELARVPTVTGRQEGDAVNELRRAGLEVRVRTEAVPPGDTNAGRVIRQDPSGGAQVPPGSTVTIVVGVESAPPTTTTDSDDGG